MELGLYIKEQNKTDLKTEFKKSRFNSFEDYLIHEVRELRKQVKKLNIDDVSKQRELLIAAAKGMYPHGDQKQLTKLIDKYLQGK